LTFPCDYYWAASPTPYNLLLNFSFISFTSQSQKKKDFLLAPQCK
jgi:hypothetical protein